MLDIYAYTLSPLPVTSNPLILKTYVCVFSTFFTSNPPFSKACVAKLTRVCSLQSLVSLEAESLLYFGVEGHRFFPGVGTIMNFKPFDEMIDSNYLSLIVFLFVLLLVFMLQFGKKDKKLELSPLRIITSQRWNRKWGDLLHPRFFKIWIWWSINKKFDTIRRCACRSPFAYFFFFLDFGFGSYLIERGGCTLHTLW